MNGGRLLRASAAIVVVGALGSIPAADAASVSTVFRPPSDCYKAVCNDYGGNFVTFAADAGEANRLTVLQAGSTSAGSTAVFTEAAVQVRAGNLCAQRTFSSASCEGSVSVNTADGDDRVDDTAGARVDGGEGNDLLRGTGSLLGGPGSDRLEGVGSAEFGRSLTGGPGSDTLTGTAGRDEFVDGDSGEPDTFNGGDGSDSVSYAGRATPVRLTLGVGGTEDTLNSIESIGGGSADDTLTGDAGPNALAGSRGRDVIVGGAGDDHLGGSALENGLGVEGPKHPAYDAAAFGADEGNQIDAGPGADSVEGAGGPDRLTGGDGDDMITGGRGTDSIQGEGGADTLGGGGASLLEGGTGNDRLVSAGGGSRLFGGPGNDTIVIQDVVKKKQDRIRCGAGKDTVDVSPLDSLDSPARGLRIPADCEAAQYGTEFTLVGSPKRAGRYIRLRMRRGSEPSGTDRIRLFSRGKLLGVSRRITRSATYRVKLNRAGRRLARRGRTISLERRAVKKADREKESEHALRYTLR